MQPLPTQLFACIAWTALLFLTGLSIEHDGVHTAVGLLLIFTALPLFLVAMADLVRARNSRGGGSLGAILSFPARALIGLLGLCGVLFGAAIVVAVIYDAAFGDEGPAPYGPFTGFGVAPTMVLVGWNLVCVAFGAREDEPLEPQATEGVAGDPLP